MCINMKNKISKQMQRFECLYIIFSHHDGENETDRLNFLSLNLIGQCGRTHCDMPDNMLGSQSIELQSEKINHTDKRKTKFQFFFSLRFVYSLCCIEFVTEHTIEIMFGKSLLSKTQKSRSFLLIFQLRRLQL